MKQRRSREEMLNNLYEMSDEASVKEMADAVNVPACVAESFAVLMGDKKQAVLLTILANDIRNGRLKIPDCAVFACYQVASIADLNSISDALALPRKKRELTPEMRIARYNAKLEKLKKHYGIKDEGIKDEGIKDE